MKLWYLPIAISFAAMAFAQPNFDLEQTHLASLDEMQTYPCYKTDSPIVIDGDLSEPTWKETPWSRAFIDIEGKAKPLPRFQTNIKMRWDDQYFYIAAMLQEPHVWGTITKRDEVIFRDNDFEVFMDPDGDNFEYGEFEINALNTGWDLFLPKPYKDNGQADNSWDISGIKTAVKIIGTINDPSDNDVGWMVEIAMPWKSLSRISHTDKAPIDGQQWHINFSRVEWTTNIVDGKYVKVANRAEDNWVWSAQRKINMHLPEMWGIVQFSTKPVGTKLRIEDWYSSERATLHLFYYAQVEYQKENKVYADQLKQLSRSESSILHSFSNQPINRNSKTPIQEYPSHDSELTLKTNATKDQYIITMPCTDRQGNPMQASINQDSHFTVEPVKK